MSTVIAKSKSGLIRQSGSNARLVKSSLSRPGSKGSGVVASKESAGGEGPKTAGQKKTMELGKTESQQDKDKKGGGFMMFIMIGACLLLVIVAAIIGVVVGTQSETNTTETSASSSATTKPPTSTTYIPPQSPPPEGEYIVQVWSETAENINLRIPKEHGEQVQVVQRANVTFSLHVVNRPGVPNFNATKYFHLSYTTDSLMRIDGYKKQQKLNFTVKYDPTKWAAYEAFIAYPDLDNPDQTHVFGTKQPRTIDWDKQVHIESYPLDGGDSELQWYNCIWHSIDCSQESCHDSDSTTESNTET